MTRRWIADARSGAWLNRRRAVAYGGILLALELIAFLFLIAGAHGWIVPLDKVTTTDFASFYAAGDLANAGTAAATYDPAAHLAAEERATSPGIDYVVFVYPPVFLMLCALLARLPYLIAFVVFETATVIPCMLALRRILDERGLAILLPLLAFPAVVINFGEGQNAFVTAALFGGATLLVDRRPILAGLLFGALCYKPHFGLMVPFALLASGRWRAAGATALTATALVLASAALFGWGAWESFLGAFLRSHATYESGSIDFAAFVTPFGALRLVGLPPSVAYPVQAVISLAAGLFTAAVWRMNLSLPVRAATLAATTLVALPLALFYDLMIAAVAIAWLARRGRERGFLPWEVCVLMAAYCVPALARGVGLATHVPLAAIAGFALVGLCAAHAWGELRERRGDAPARTSARIPGRQIPA
jgi:hypothetical protein